MNATLPVTQPAATLDFARTMLASVVRRRAEQLRAGSITQERHDTDVTAARELVRLAEDEIIFGGPPLN